MKWLLVLALLCALAPASARTAFQARCEDTIGQSVSVMSSKQNGYRIDHSYSFHGLSAMKGDRAPGSYVLGLTRTASQVGIKVEGRMLSDPASGYECVAPRLEINLYYLPIVVYVGREFPPHTCSYREILAHELRHRDIYLNYLPQAEKVISAALARRFEGKPLYAPRGQARSLLQREIDSGWMPFIKNEMAKVERLQAAIDTPQEYARLGKVCAGEVQSLIRPAKSKRST
ncbi:hypothetical protein [Massilia sp. Mn16-1_5]|uniref:hypothetical protein n=1 Tax=Massilia sp. Mn16-1_5 TaxID=2079199 RepID=UPI00109ED9F7|nr:hypothetical protein [Massilia sp. Mn16-1_5]THC46138.1 hypothetical protein C2862_02615 [Massilia sp. Mn16-1_5]